MAVALALCGFALIIFAPCCQRDGLRKKITPEYLRKNDFYGAGNTFLRNNIRLGDLRQILAFELKDLDIPDGSPYGTIKTYVVRMKAYLCVIDVLDPKAPYPPEDNTIVNAFVDLNPTPPKPHYMPK